MAKRDWKIGDLISDGFQLGIIISMHDEVQSGYCHRILWLISQEVERMSNYEMNYCVTETEKFLRKALSSSG